MDFKSFKKKKNLGNKNKINLSIPWNNFSNQKKEEPEENIINKSENENSLKGFQDDDNDEIIMMKNENNEYKINTNLNKIIKEKNEFHPFKEEIPPDYDLNFNDNEKDKNESDNNNSDNKEDEEDDEEKYTNEEYIKEVMG